MRLLVKDPNVLTHYNSLRVTKAELFKPRSITIIDDVITKGNTVFACAMRLNETFPESKIQVFAPVRTQGLIPDILKLKDPSVGEITYHGWGDASRDP